MTTNKNLYFLSSQADIHEYYSQRHQGGADEEEDAQKPHNVHILNAIKIDKSGYQFRRNMNII